MAKERRRRRWGSGTFCQRHSDGRWLAAMRDEAGKRRYRYANPNTEDGAKAALADLRKEIAAGTPAPSRQVTVGGILIAWLAGREGVGSLATQVRYEELVRLHLAGLERIRLHELTREHVRAHVRELTSRGVAPATIGGVLRILRAAIEVAVGDGLIPRNVAKGVSGPSQPKSRGHALSAAQVRTLLQLAREDDLYPLWAVLVGTGLRMGEALGLRWADLALDVDPPALSVTGGIRHQDQRLRGDGLRLDRVAPKSDAGRRTIALPEFVAAAIRTQPKDAIYVFHRAAGMPLNPSTVQRQFAALVARGGSIHLWVQHHRQRVRLQSIDIARLAGVSEDVARSWELRVRPSDGAIAILERRFGEPAPKVGASALPKMRLHDLRHTAATVMLGSGASLDDVKRALGHSSIAITSDVYGHLVMERAAAIAKAVDEAVG